MKLGDKIAIELEVHEIITKKNKNTFIGLCLPNADNTENTIYVPESMLDKKGVEQVDKA